MIYFTFSLCHTPTETLFVSYCWSKLCQTDIWDIKSIIYPSISEVVFICSIHFFNLVLHIIKNCFQKALFEKYSGWIITNYIVFFFFKLCTLFCWTLSKSIHSYNTFVITQLNFYLSYKTMVFINMSTIITRKKWW